MTFHIDEKGKFFTNIITKKSIQSKIQTITHQIEGNIYTRHDERIIDELMTENQFLAVTDAVIYDMNNEVLIECEFLSINKAHIIWIIPMEEIQASQPTDLGVQD